METCLTIEYDGTDFAGWAVQPGRRTVQGELETALATLLGRPVVLRVAGRTDAGVHAWGQVAAYAGAPVRLASLNALIGDDVAVLACEPAHPGFDPRRDATARTYCYSVLARSAPSAFGRRTTLHWPYDCDRDLLHACAAALPGAHDFTAFTLTETEHRWFTRIVERAEWRECGDRLEFWITADAFLRHMTRTLVGTMLEVAQGRRTLDSFVALLTGGHRGDAGHTAKPHGLALAAVRYPVA
ncbi:MAG: tRNA pseudouridine(38-40) synthase TruA [Actinomycetota bacterium]|nr:tRNA pseudouridine(38-40) synthase TruA [Actinomycetota bacterium]